LWLILLQVRTEKRFISFSNSSIKSEPDKNLRLWRLNQYNWRKQRKTNPEPAKQENWRNLQPLNLNKNILKI
jgi:hypothetical protein